MRPALCLLTLLALSACHRVGSNPWAGVDYAETNCGTKAILSTTGCITANTSRQVTAQSTPVSIKGPNNVSETQDDALREDIDQSQGTYNTTSVHGNNTNANIHSNNSDNSVLGNDRSNSVHGNDTNANIHNATTNNNSTSVNANNNNVWGSSR